MSFRTLKRGKERLSVRNLIRLACTSIDNRPPNPDAHYISPLLASAHITHPLVRDDMVGTE